MLKKLTFLILILIFPTLLFAYKHNKREMRAVWVTTLLNLDWPSKAGLSMEEQKEEFINLLDNFQKNNINTVIVQIRPSGDAIYPSRYATWSKWLSGKQGTAPDGDYDPVEFMIKECHKRCMEFHAWMNPYRVVFNYETSPAPSYHISNKKTEWVVTYGKHQYLNPGIPEVRKYITNIICEVVDKYNIDAIHFDDYFYPHETKNKNFKDSVTYVKYGQDFDNLKDWRRDNVNKFIKTVSDSIHSKKANVKFGVSPFPVWRNKAHDAEKGVDLRASSSYDDLCADVLLWTTNKWIDYVMPQLYGNIGHKYLDYSVLVEWWNKYCENTNVYIGQAIYKLDINSKYSEWTSSDEILDQLSLNNKYESIKGHAFFRAKYLTKNPLHISESLERSFHKYPSLLPLNKNIPEINPKKLNLVFLKKSSKENKLLWTNNSEKNEYFIVYRYKSLFPKYSAENIYKITKNLNIEISDEEIKKGYKYRVASISKSHHESRSTKAYTIDLN